jgi:branched-chain amino acid transport system ATP-binding protein
MGKTTLIRTIMGLVRPRSGAVSVGGTDVTRDPAFRIAQRGIAYVPEGRGIFGALSVRENLEIAERPGVDGTQPWTTARVLKLFPRLGQRLRNGGDQLSGGEQQMLAIARALLTNPRVLILDEATEGLAPLIRAEIWNTVRLVRQSGIATLLVDKSVSEVTAVADRVVILVKGQIVFEGTPDALKADPELMHRHLGV